MFSISRLSDSTIASVFCCSSNFVELTYHFHRYSLLTPTSFQSRKECHFFDGGATNHTCLFISSASLISNVEKDYPVVSVTKEIQRYVRSTIEPHSSSVKLLLSVGPLGLIIHLSHFKLDELKSLAIILWPRFLLPNTQTSSISLVKTSPAFRYHNFGMFVDGLPRSGRGWWVSGCQWPPEESNYRCGAPL